MEEDKVVVAVEEEGEFRVDKYLSNTSLDLSRSYIQKLIKEERITVNGKAIKANYLVSNGDIIEIIVPKPIEPDLKPENIPLNVLYEDEDLILINKPKNMVVHPAPGHSAGTLVNALLYHCKGRLSGINGIMRPGIVHRIDKDTTGVLIACKNDVAHREIAEQIKSHSITRKYEAIVFQPFHEMLGTVEGWIGRHPTDRKKMTTNVKNGKYAITHYRVIQPLNQRFTHIECILETGRTHQIRVHMASINHPVLGDVLYGPKRQPFPLDGQALHASTLGFIHPKTKEYMEFEAPLPEYFKNLLQKLSNGTKYT